MDDSRLQIEYLSQRTRALERRLRWAIFLWLLSGTVIITSAWAWPALTQHSPSVPALRASELVIVDQKGVERVRIGGDLPDALIGGKRVPRGEKAAGVLLYDGSGQERSGYVTFEPSGNVGLTLDTRRQQVALFVAGPDSGSALQMWHGNHLIELRSDDDGSRMTAAKDRQVVTQEPAISKMSAETCAAYRSARSRVSSEQVMRDCRRRFTDAACTPCLAQP